MQFEVDPITALVTLVAVITSTYFYFKSHSLMALIKDKDEQLNSATFFLSRNEIFEGKLFDHPDCLKLYGIDLDEVHRDGISHQQIAYLVQGFNIVAALKKSGDITSYEDYIDNNEYLKFMFSQEQTIKAWKYAKVLVNADVKTIIDERLVSHEAIKLD